MIFGIIFLHAAILWVLEFFLYPELLIYPYLVVSGFLPYKNILDQHFPGLMFFPVNFYSLGFTEPVHFRTLLILIVCIQSLVVYKIGTYLGGKKVGLLASVAYLIWQPFFEGNQLWLDIFLPLFTLPALWFFLKEKWFWAGLCLGLGIVFKQTQVPLVAFAGLLILWKYKSQSLLKLVKFSLGALLPSAVMLIYLAKIGVLSDFWYWTIKFNLSEFASGGSLAPRPADLIRLTLPVVIILLSLVFVKAEYKIKLLVGWMLLTIAGGIARFGLLHFQPAVPYLSLICGLLMISLFWQKKKIVLAGLIGLIIVWLGYFYFRQQNLFQTKFYDAHNGQIVADIKDRTQPGDKVFLLGVHPHLYVLTQTLPPGKMFIFQFPWFFKVAGDRVLASLQNDPPRIVVYDDGSSIDGQYMRDYGKFVLDYIHQNYSLALQRGSVEIYEHRH